MGIIEKYNDRMAKAQDARDAAFALCSETFAKAAEAYHAANMDALVAYNAEVEAVGREFREAIHGPSETPREPIAPENVIPPLKLPKVVISNLAMATTGLTGAEDDR